MMESAATVPLSVVIMTYNEETNLARCLESVKDIGNECLILDSYSTDHTVDIARSFGARVEQHVFSDFVSQRQHLLELASHRWVLMLDADERLSPTLRHSIEQAIRTSGADGYSFNRRNRIGDTWIRYGSWYPDRKLRLFDKEKFRVDGTGVHETMVPIASARVEHLHGDLLHDADEDVHARMAKIHTYSLQAAQGMFNKGMKPAVWRVCIKPFIRFCSVYLIRLGLLDGYYGYVIARSEAMYVWMREVKLWEMHRKAKQG